MYNKEPNNSILVYTVIHCMTRLTNYHFQIVFLDLCFNYPDYNVVLGAQKFICLPMEPVPYLMDCLASYPFALIFHYNVKLLCGY